MQCGEQHSVGQGQALNVSCSSAMGRYVFVVIPGSSKTLTLCEVEVVTGVPGPSSALTTAAPTTAAPTPEPTGPTKAPTAAPITSAPTGAPTAPSAARAALQPVEGDVRLTAYPKGRIEVFRDGVWGTLCGAAKKGYCDDCNHHRRGLYAPPIVPGSKVFNASYFSCPPGDSGPNSDGGCTKQRGHRRRGPSIVNWRFQPGELCKYLGYNSEGTFYHDPMSAEEQAENGQPPQFSVALPEYVNELKASYQWEIGTCLHTSRGDNGDLGLNCYGPRGALHNLLHR